MHVVICEDETCYRTAIEEALTRWSLAAGYPNIHVSVYASSEDLYESWQHGLPIDLLFLDIQIPDEMDGMDLARRIRERDQTMSIVFITNYSAYVYEGYTVQALRYLQKPVREEDLFACLDIAYRHFTLLRPESIVVDTRQQRLVLRHYDLCYIEARAHYVALFVSHLDSPISIRARLDDFILKLPPQLFVQCHRSYAVNLAHIRRLTKNSADLSNGHTIPVSQTYFHTLNSAFERYYGEEKI